jgi:hypothetical protein
VTEPEKVERVAASGSKLAALALALVPASSAAAVWLSPKVAVASPLADVLAVAIAVLPSLAALALASRARLDVRPQLALAGAAAAGLVAVGIVGLVASTVPLQATCLVTLGFGVGGLIGSKIEHPGHVLPAAFVASAADLASVLSPEGPSNAALSSDKAMSVLALAAPIPGSDAFTFVLGLGDWLFLALLLRVGVELGVGARRVALAALGGLVLAFGASALLGRAVPALVTIGLVATLSVPAFRRVRKRDRRVTQIAIAASIAVALGVLARAAMGG